MERPELEGGKDARGEGTAAGGAADGMPAGKPQGRGETAERLTGKGTKGPEIDGGSWESPGDPVGAEGSMRARKRETKQLAGKSWPVPVQAIDQCDLHTSKGRKDLL